MMYAEHTIQAWFTPWFTHICQYKLNWLINWHSARKSSIARTHLFCECMPRISYNICRQTLACMTIWNKECPNNKRRQNCPGGNEVVKWRKKWSEVKQWSEWKWNEGNEVITYLKRLYHFTLDSFPVIIRSIFRWEDENKDGNMRENIDIWNCKRPWS